MADLGPSQVPSVPLHPEAAHQEGPPLHLRAGPHSVRFQGGCPFGALLLALFFGLGSYRGCLISTTWGWEHWTHAVDALHLSKEDSHPRAIEVCAGHSPPDSRAGTQVILKSSTLNISKLRQEMPKLRKSSAIHPETTCSGFVFRFCLSNAPPSSSALASCTVSKRSRTRPSLYRLGGCLGLSAFLRKVFICQISRTPHAPSIPHRRLPWSSPSSWPPWLSSARHVDQHSKLHEHLEDPGALGPKPQRDRNLRMGLRKLRGVFKHWLPQHERAQNWGALVGSLFHPCSNAEPDTSGGMYPRRDRVVVNCSHE